MLSLNSEFKNPVKEKLKNGEKTCGAWLQAANPFTAEIMAKAGFDWLMIDMEHGPGDIMTLISQLQAIKGYDVIPFARAPWNDFVYIKKMLDAGLYGLLIPYVNTKEDAQNAVLACKYPLEGIRGVAPSPRAPGYGMNSMNYLKTANKEILIMTAVETPEAVKNIDGILEVDGLDGVFIGPMDLATSMGYFCNPTHNMVQETIALIEQKVLASGKILGTVAGSIDVAKKLFDKGYRFVTLMSDTTTLAKIAMETVKNFRAEIG